MRSGIRPWEYLILLVLLLAGGAFTLNNPLPREYSPPPHCAPNEVPVRDESGKWICINLNP